jgi:hypothetical protein
MSIALCRSGQHCNERSIVIELNEKIIFSSLSLSLSCQLVVVSSVLVIIMMMPRL